MAQARRAMVTVRRVAKGQYVVKLPKKLPKRQPKVAVVDAVPVLSPVVVSAEVSANGILGKATANVKVSRVAKGIYNLTFLDSHGGTIAVFPGRKPHSPYVRAMVSPTTPTHVTIVLTTTRGVQVDRPFMVTAILDDRQKVK